MSATNRRSRHDPLAKDALRGSITPLITPFRDGRVDYDTYATLVERHIGEGGHGVLVNGTSAEPSTLTVEERNRLVQLAIEVAKGRTQIVAATGSQSFAETQALTDFAAKAGVDALLIVTPYYIRPPQRGLVEYYAALGKRSDLPLMIYHIPVPRGRQRRIVDRSSKSRIVCRTSLA